MTAKFLQGASRTIGFQPCEFQRGRVFPMRSTIKRRCRRNRRRIRRRTKASRAAPPVNKAEEDAYKAFFAARTGSPATQIQLGEDFIAKFPNSHYLGAVYGTLTAAYFNLGQVDKMFAAGAKALELNPDNVDVLCLLAMAIPRRVQPSAPDAAQQLQKAEGICASCHRADSESAEAA